jgi:ABC-2 type transport system ATP-binding protein
MLEILAIRKSFSKNAALNDVSCWIKTGTITALTGADGAGKSTLLMILVGLLHPDSGKIIFEGQELIDRRPLLKACGYMPEQFSLYSDLSVDENLDFFAAIKGLSKKQSLARKQELLTRTGMEPFRLRRARDLSGGMKQKLALMTVLLPSPRLLILDEPTSGIDPQSRLEFFSIVQELKAEQRTVLFSTPYFDEAGKADTAVVLNQGQVLCQAAPAQLINELPAKIYRLLPKGNPLEIISRCEQDERLHGALHLRGQFIIYMQTGPENLLSLIPHLSAVLEPPTLEDVYMVYKNKISYKTGRNENDKNS